MQDNSRDKKKTLVVSVLAFLFIGGGVFLFFIIQGSNDLTGKGKNSFSYGAAAREGVSSFFKSLGVIPEDELKLSDSAVARLSTRGLLLDELGVKDSNPDMSDWMQKSSDGSSPAPGSSRGSATAVPRMSGAGGSGLGGKGGGGTSSSGGVSRFGEGSTAGNTTVSAKAQGGAGGPAGKGTLLSLKNARAMLGEGLRSDSAMTARSKWGQSFGVGGGGKSGDLAYNKSGLINLDKIKSGEIASLKMDSNGSLKTTEVSSPVKDNEGTSKALDADKKTKEDMDAKMKAEAIKAAAEAATQAATKPGDKPAAGPASGDKPRDPNVPPPDVAALGNNAKPPPEGKFCPDGCATSDGKGSYKDNEAQFKNNGKDGWTVTYSGVQTNPDGTTFEYSDTMSIDPKGNPPMQLVNVVEGAPK